MNTLLPNLLLLDADWKLFGLKFYDNDFLELITRFIFNTLVAIVIIYYIYYKHQKKSEYTFTFFVFNVLIFFMCYLMSSAKISLGFAFGLFAVFSVLRYRTNPIPIKEMTYLFIVIAVSVINAVTTKKVSYVEILTTNFIIIFISYFVETIWYKRELKQITVEYEKIENIHVSKQKTLMKELQERTGLDIQWFEVVSADYLRDSAKIRVFYRNQS